MSKPIPIGFLIVLLSLGAMLFPAAAQQPNQKPDRVPKRSVELRESEITGSLRDIVGAFKLNETEIVGTTDQPRFNYMLPWQDPDPFPGEEIDLAQGLIEQNFVPFELESHGREIPTTTGP